MRTDDMLAVRGLALFADMEKAHFDELVSVSYLQRFPPQVQLITEGDKADFLHVVVDGAVELFANGNNKESIIDILRPVATFILAAVLSDRPHLMSARTLVPSRILLIPAEIIRSVMNRDAAFAKSIVIELSIRYRTAVHALKNQKLRTALERLADYLLQQHDEQGGRGSLDLPIDKRTLASLLGMTPENLSRAFGTLQPYGVEVEGPHIRLTKIADLRTLAKPYPRIEDC